MAKNIKFNEEDGTILIKNVRGSYLHLFEKWGKEEDPKEKWKYSGKFLLDKKTHAEEIKAIKQFLLQKQQEWFKGKIGTANLFFRDGADSGKDEQENAWVISASESRRRPQVMNRDKSPITAEDDIVYSGCYVNVLIRPWKQENKHGKKINANLVGVQFVRDGERFGDAGIDASERFDEEDAPDTDDFDEGDDFDD